MADTSIVFVLLLSLLMVIAGEKVIQMKLEAGNVKKDDYYCTSVDVPGDGYIVGFNPHMLSSVVHHMILYGCTVQRHTSEWDCIKTSVCSNGPKQLLYAWALQADGLNLPKDVGFKVGGVSSKAIHYLVMEVHYENTPTSKDVYPVLDILFTETRMPYIAGVYLVGRYISSGLVPGQKNITLDGGCYYSANNTIVPFAFRTHAHDHGTAMYGYVIDSDLKWNLIGQRNPQDPQAFYPVINDNLVINPGDIIAARTYFNTENEDNNISFGAHSNDEMSNFYIMYYTNNNDILLSKEECWSEPPSNITYPVSDATLPLHGTHHDRTHDHHIHDDHTHNELASIETIPNIQLDNTWPYNNGFINPIGGIAIGMISAIDLDDNNNVYILHRSTALWKPWSFDEHNVYTSNNNGPITDSVLIKLDSKDGSFINSWGNSVFYIPHGLRISNDGQQYWITDVARHQLLKNINKRVSVLGESFVPGNDNSHFCQPTDIEIYEDHNIFYIADGYCNHRVIAYTLNGQFLYQFPSIINGQQLFVPHSLALTKDGSQLFVADRQNGRIIVYNTTTHTGRVFVDNHQLNGFVFAIAFGNHDNDWPLYAINGSVNEDDRCYGFTINKEGVVIDTWGPEMGFSQPHDLAVTNNGDAIYIVQLESAKVWRFTISNPYSTPMAASTVHPMAAPTLIHPIPSAITTTTTSSPLPWQPNQDTDDGDDYSCPHPPPPPTSCNTCSPTVHLSSPIIITDTPTEGGLSLYIILIIIGGIIWLAFICFICIALCCTNKFSTIITRNKRSIIHVNRHYSTDPKRKLRSLLNKNSRNGFHIVSAVDSESDTELTVFQKT